MKNTSKILEYNNKVYLYYSQKGKLVRIPTGVNWNELKENQNHIDKLLNNLNKIVIDYFYKENVYPDVSYIKSKMNLVINKKDDINSLFDIFLNNKIEKDLIKKNTISNLTKVKNYLIKYSENIEKIDVNKLNEPFILKFQDYLNSNEISDNTQIQYIKTLKTFIKYCESNNLVKRNFIDWEKIGKRNKKYKTEKQTLTNDEISFLISKIDIEKKYKKVLDIWLFQIFCGVRFSDLLAIDKKHLNGNKLILNNQKTGTEIFVDLNGITQDILERYDYNISIDLTDYDKNIKLLLKKYSEEMPSFKKEIYVKKNRNCKEEFEKKFRYDCFSSHSARRTYITRCIELGVPTNILMEHTGHSNIQTLNGYINKKTNREANLSELMLSNKKFEH